MSPVALLGVGVVGGLLLGVLLTMLFANWRIQRNGLAFLARDRAVVDALARPNVMAVLADPHERARLAQILVYAGDIYVAGGATEVPLPSPSCARLGEHGEELPGCRWPVCSCPNAPSRSAPEKEDGGPTC